MLQSMTCVVLDAINQQIIAVRNGSPLVIGFGRSENLLASDALVLLPFTRRVYFLEDGQMAIMTQNQVVIKNINTNRNLNFSIQKLNWQISQTSLGKYPHYLLKEIYEQPQVISNIAKTNTAQITKLAKLIKKSYGAYLLGCGSAAHAALAGVYLFSKIAKQHINWAIGSEFGYHLDFLTSKSLVIALSQSGETMDTLESVKKKPQFGAHKLPVWLMF